MRRRGLHGRLCSLELHMHMHNMCTACYVLVALERKMGGSDS